MDWIQKKWKEIGFIFLVVSLAFNFYGWKTQASETQQKVVSFEETFQNVASIAQDLKDPNTWLRNFLINHNIDSVVAKIWSLYPKGIIITKEGDSLRDIPYLDTECLPDIGIYKILKGDSVKTIDTLWNFIKKRE